MDDLKIHTFTELSERVVNSLVELEREIFDNPLSKDALRKELEGKRKLLVLIAMVAEVKCGFKVGFEYSPDTFFSWIGGVHPSYRRHRIASVLMAEQHRLAKDAGFSYVRTHTKNKYREMLILNIQSGFDVTGIYKKPREAQHGIILEKEL